MKTKHWIYLSQVLLIPIFISTMMISMICGEWLLTNQSQLGTQILETGTFNKPVATILFGISVIGLSIVFVVFLILSKHANDIDRLEDAIHQHYLAKLKYNAATRKFVDQM
jgi:hypothetical protein